MSLPTLLLAAAAVAQGGVTDGSQVLPRELLEEWQTGWFELHGAGGRIGWLSQSIGRPVDEDGERLSVLQYKEDQLVMVKFGGVPMGFRRTTTFVYDLDPPHDLREVLADNGVGELRAVERVGRFKDGRASATAGGVSGISRWEFDSFELRYSDIARLHVFLDGPRKSGDLLETRRFDWQTCQVVPWKVVILDSGQPQASEGIAGPRFQMEDPIGGVGREHVADADGFWGFSQGFVGYEVRPASREQALAVPDGEPSEFRTVIPWSGAIGDGEFHLRLPEWDDCPFAACAGQQVVALGDEGYAMVRNEAVDRLDSISAEHLAPFADAAWIPPRTRELGEDLLRELGEAPTAVHRVERAREFVSNAISVEGEVTPRQMDAVLDAGMTDSKGSRVLLLGLLRSMGLPSRFVECVLLTPQGDDGGIMEWQNCVEAYVDGRWRLVLPLSVASDTRHRLLRLDSTGQLSLLEGIQRGHVIEASSGRPDLAQDE